MHSAGIPAGGQWVRKVDYQLDAKMGDTALLGGPGEATLSPEFLRLLSRSATTLFRKNVTTVTTMAREDVVLFVSLASRFKSLLLRREANELQRDRDDSAGERQQKAKEKLEEIPWGTLLKDKVVATVFFEPSTRTRCSFEAATLRLGGKLLSCGDMQTTSSTKKGETLEDSMRMFAAYSDAIILRHPQKGSMERAAEAIAAGRQRGRLQCPLLNAGDGAGEHPTQALLDLFTLAELRPAWWQAEVDKIAHHSCGGNVSGNGKLSSTGSPEESKLTVAFVGDLKNGRTVHSLAILLSRFDCWLTAVSTPEFSLPGTVEETVRRNFEAQGFTAKDRLTITEDFESAIECSDVLYMTRLQAERLTEAFKKEAPGSPFPASSFQLTSNLLKKHAKPHLKVMHPLPRVDEISADVDSTVHCAYFDQAENGLYMRMALLAVLLNRSAVTMLLDVPSLS